MYGIIYMTTNLINGRRYIGQHKCKNENDNYLGSGKALLKAIELYGRKNFKRETLCIADSEEDLNRLEMEYIAKYNASHDRNFYNLNDGGKANRMSGENNPMYGRRGVLAPSYGRKISEEERQKRSEAMKGDKNPWYGHVYSEEERKKFGKKGEQHWNYGKHWDEEVKAKMSKAKKGKPSKIKGVPKSEEQKRKQSEVMKGRKPNLTPEQIEAHRQIMLEYKHSDESKQKIGKANKRFHETGGRRGAKPVICIETNIVYASSYDAARSVGCGLSSISACISGSCKTVKGFHWRHATLEEASGELVYAP